MAETKQRSWYGPWNDPDVESIDLYPGLVVHDGRVSGSITVGESRLPLWAFAGWDWDEVVRGWDYIEGPGYEWTEEKQRQFLFNLLNQRGDFARLLLVIADAERLEAKRGAPFSGPSWWATKKHRKRVGDALRRCLEILEQPYGPALPGSEDLPPSPEGNEA